MRSSFPRVAGRVVAGLALLLAAIQPRADAQCIVSFALDPPSGAAPAGGAVDFVLQGLARGTCGWVARPTLDAPPPGITIFPAAESALIPSGSIGSLRAQVRVAADVAPGAYELRVRLDLVRVPAGAQAEEPRVLIYTLRVPEPSAGPGDLIATPTGLDFGEQGIARALPAERVLTLRNGARENLRVNGLEIRGGQESRFLILDAVTTPFLLRPGEAREIRVWFDPREAGAFRDALLIRSTALDNGVALVPLRGRTPGLPDPLQGEVWVDRGCGAVYPVGSRITIRYWASRAASVTLLFRGADGAERVLARQVLPAGAVATFAGTVTEPLGTRRLFLDVNDGLGSIRTECAYAAGGGVP